MNSIKPVVVWSRTAETNHAKELDEAYAAGAAAAFGLMGMVDSIKRGEQHRRNILIHQIGVEAGTHCLECLEVMSDGWPNRFLCKRHREGAAMAFGMMGMANSIKENQT